MLLAATFADLRLHLSSNGRDITRLFCHSNSFLLSDVDLTYCTVCMCFVATQVNCSYVICNVDGDDL